MSGHSRRDSLRYPGYDYSQAGWYFITTCTEDRRWLFGTIDAGRMIPNEAGDMVTDLWHQLPARYPGVMLDMFQLMPDHVHGIVFLGTDPTVAADHQLGELMWDFKGRSTTQYFAGVHRGEWPRVDGRVWQRSYYDRIIRTERELEQIRAYIEGNPGRWWERRRG